MVNIEKTVKNRKEYIKIMCSILMIYLFSTESVGKSDLCQSRSAGGSAVSQPGKLKT